MKRKKKILRIFYSKAMLLTLFIFCLLLGYSVLSIFQKRSEAAEKTRIAKEELARIEERNQSISESLDTLDTEQGLERVIREKYQLAKEGEGLIVVTEPDDEEKNNTTQSSDTSFWNKMKNAFGR